MEDWAQVEYWQNVRLRSANRNNAYNTWNVNTTGNVNDNNAYNANRCAPIVFVYECDKDAYSAFAQKTGHKEPKPKQLRDCEQWTSDATSFRA